MREVSKEHQGKLEELKGYVDEYYTYWRDNNKRFNDSKNFIFATALSQADLSKLKSLQKPALEFNTTEAFISKQRGEFSEHEPTLSVGVADGVLPSRITDQTLKMHEVVQGHVSEILFEAKQRGLQDHFYNDSMGGGFAVCKVSTDYIDPMSFEQKIIFDRVFDPTLCGFDPLAREVTKCDGRYCFEIIPKTKEDFEKEYGYELTKSMKFSRNLSNYVWSYSGAKQKLVMIAEIWVKKLKRVKISKMSNGHSILTKHLPKLKEIWEMQQRIEQMPIPIEERWTIIESIDLYQVCENKVLSHTETDYGYLPMVFIDGNSVITKKSEHGTSTQLTRSYAYQVKGIQKLKNLAGQTIASEIETMVQNKWIVCAESLDEDYLEAFKNPQQMTNILYSAFFNGNPEHPLPPPREVVRTPMPEIVNQTFMQSDLVMQSILGNFDNQIAVNKDTSGAAIDKGAIQSSAAARPFLTNYVCALNQVGKIILDLIPKYYVTPRSIPVRKPNGTRDFEIINDPNDKNSLQINYRPRDLQIKIEAGVNSKLEKRKTLEQIASLMSASEMFARFANEELLPYLVQNLDVKGGESLIKKAEQFMQRTKEAQEAAAGQPTPEDKLIQAEVSIEHGKTEQRRTEAEGKLAAEAARIAIDQENADREWFKLLAEVEAIDKKTMRDFYALDHEMSVAAVDSALSVSQHQLAVSQAKQEQEMAQNQGNQQNEIPQQ